MFLEHEIEAAIHVHERWKARLTASIENGVVDVDISDVGKDNMCAFGRWLCGSPLPEVAGYDPNYIIVKFLHSKFHECAGHVLQMLSEGNVDEARKLMAWNGAYTTTSDQLIAALVKWKMASQPALAHGLR
jgi:hypothetical protein